MKWWMFLLGKDNPAVRVLFAELDGFLMYSE